jgi:hypothetical protein
MEKSQKKVRLRLLMPFQCWCLSGEEIHKHFKLLDFFKAKYEKKNYEQSNKIYSNL